MGPWQYQDPVFLGDPAGGSILWATFVKNAPAYYLYKSDIAILNTHADKIANAFRTIKTMVEVGPGSPQSITNKTIPALSLSPKDCGYLAIDCDRYAAASAAQMVARSTKRQTDYSVKNGFELADIQAAKPVALAIFGGTWANIEGALAQPYHVRLQHMVQNYCAALRAGDVVLGTFDTNINTASLMHAYDHPDHAAFGVSALHLMAQQQIIRGNFDPYVWRYKPVISSAHRQVAHCVYATTHQSFTVNGHLFDVAPHTLWVMNNSYKYAPDDVKTAFTLAGIDTTIFQTPQNPMALVLGTKK